MGGGRGEERKSGVGGCERIKRERRGNGKKRGVMRGKEGGKKRGSAGWRRI